MNELIDAAAILVLLALLIVSGTTIVLSVLTFFGG